MAGLMVPAIGGRTSLACHHAAIRGRHSEFSINLPRRPCTTLYRNLQSGPDAVPQRQPPGPAAGRYYGGDQEIKAVTTQLRMLPRRLPRPWDGPQACPSGARNTPRQLVRGGCGAVEPRHQSGGLHHSTSTRARPLSTTSLSPVLCRCSTNGPRSPSTR